MSAFRIEVRAESLRVALAWRADGEAPLVRGFAEVVRELAAM